MQRLTTVFRYAIVFAVMLSLGALSALATGRITGKITDDDTKAALSGVSIKVKVGAKVMGAFSAKDGSYEIRNVPAGSYDITASYIGFKSQTKKITVTDDADVSANFNMQLDLLLLEEAVVIGYGTKQRKDITGSISSVTASEIKDAPLPSFEQMIAGRATGVQVIASNGTPGATVMVRVRGTGSITASSEPLYIVDGIPITSGNLGTDFRTATTSNALSDINPNDIESMEVLKDADATAIYGARGANGVVLITTKRGQAGTTKFTASYVTTFNDVTNRLRLYDGPGWLNLWNEANRNDSITSGKGAQFRRKSLPFNIYDPTSGLAKRAGQIDPANTNWLDQVLQIGRINEFNVSASGGTEKTTFYAGATYRNESGFVKTSNFERIAGRLNLDHKATEDFKIGFNASVSRTQNARVPVAWAGGLGAAQSNALPIFPIFDPVVNDGSTYYRGASGNNPAAQIDPNNYSFTETSTRLIASGYGEFQFNGLGIPGLVARVEASIDRRSQQESFYQSSAIRGDGRAFSELRDVNGVNWNTNTTLNYNTKVGESDFGLLVGMSVNRYDQLDVGANGKDFPNPYFTNPQSGAIKQGFSNQTAFSFIGYFARADYKLRDRYLIKASVRRDGSSRFGDSTRFGLFPAVGLGWIVSEEDFLKNNETISLLKLRGSYGLTGNAEIPNFDRYGTYFAGADYNGQPGIAPGRLPNTRLGWERATTLDVGLDVAFWGGRLSTTLAYYNKTTTDLLLNVSTPASIGFGSVLQNVGTINNNGVEVTISSKNLVGDFTWSTDFNIAFNRNNVIDNAGLPPDAVGGPGETRILPGYPIGTFFINRFARVQSKTEMVNIQFRDTVQLRNPNGSITIQNNTTTFDPNKPESRANVSGKWSNKMVLVKGGSPLFYNLNGELTDTYDTQDRVPLGQPYPIAFGAITNTFTYAGFDLMFLINFSIGNSIYDDAAKRQVANPGFNWNQRVNETADRWQKEGDVTTVPRLTLAQNGDQSDARDINTDRWIYDGTFARLRQVTLGYRIPASALETLGLTNVRIYFTATNPLVISRFPGWDPEIFRDVYSAREANLGASVTYLTPPPAKGYTLGISVGF
jgi:TonB-dependent starch-binding outer membrane protein SusC